ncbi:MAG: hypothetical protein ACKVW3_14575 [Phycisphaerales bacterium]
MRRRTMSMGLVAMLAFWAGGCGWTMRDEFYSARAVTIPAAAGDGSRLVMAPATSDQALADDLDIARR